MKRLMPVLCVGLLLGSLCGCPSVQRVDPDVEVFVTLDFNPTDLLKIAKGALQDLLSKPGVFPESRRPLVYFATVKNRTDEHIEMEAIAEFISVELGNTGRVQLTEVRKGLQEAISQIEFQQGALVDPTTGKKVGKIEGADYFLQGELTSMRTNRGGRRGQSYQFALTLVNIETLHSWKGLQRVQKVAKRGWFGW